MACLFWESFLHIWQETDLNSYGHLSRSKTFCQVCKISTLNECLQYLSLLPHNDTLPGCFLHWLFEVPRDPPTPHSPSASEKEDLVLKVNPTQQDWRMALFLGCKYFGSGQTAVRTFSSGTRALNTLHWCTYMVYWLPTSMPICSHGLVPTHKLAGSLPLVWRCQAMMGLDGQPA